MVTYYWSFIQKFSSTAKPLTELMRMDSKLEWTVKEQQAFDIFRRKLTKNPILIYPDISKEFYRGSFTAKRENQNESGILCQYSDN